MRHTTAACILTAIAAVSNAKYLVRRQDMGQSDLSPLDVYFADVCLPVDSSADPDYSAPCNGLGAVDFQCAYGSAAFSAGVSDNNSSDVTQPLERNRTSPSSQQVCYCQSQWFNLYEGCLDCANKHGVSAALPQISASALTSFSSSYCAASATPTTDFDVYLNSVFSDLVKSVESGTATTFTDPIGNKTDVSLYYTASVTGSNAYIVSQAAPTGASATTTASTTVNTSGGQIVATAANGSNGGSGAAATSSSATSSGLAAAATPCLEKFAIAGVMGLAGAVIML